MYVSRVARKHIRAVTAAALVQAEFHPGAVAWILGSDRAPDQGVTMPQIEG
jgi:hypothetical protein